MDAYSVFENKLSDIDSKKAIQSGADSQTLEYAKSKLGSHEYKMLCQRLVNEATGSKYGSAIEAWNSQKGIPGILGAKPGDPVYFGATPNNQY
jgi:hypothetical protein